MEAGRFGFLSKSSEIVDLGKKIYKILTLENQYQIWTSDCLSGESCYRCVTSVLQCALTPLEDGQFSK